MRLFRAAWLLSAASICVCAQTVEPPTVGEVLRQVPLDAKALDFLQIGLCCAWGGASGHGDAHLPGDGIGHDVYTVGYAGVMTPHVLKAPDPEYPMKSYPQEGTVVLWVILGPDGKPCDIKVKRTLGKEFDKAAIAAVRKWRFDPALKDGKPVAVQINIEVNFRVAR